MSICQTKNGSKKNASSQELVKPEAEAFSSKHCTSERLSDHVCKKNVGQSRTTFWTAAGRLRMVQYLKTFYEHLLQHRLNIWTPQEVCGRLKVVQCREFLTQIWSWPHIWTSYKIFPLDFCGCATKVNICPRIIIWTCLKPFCKLITTLKIFNHSQINEGLQRSRFSGRFKLSIESVKNNQIWCLLKCQDN